MATIPKTYESIMQLYHGKVFNPGHRYITELDEQTYLREAVQRTAQRLGGLRVKDETVSTVAGTAAYTVNNKHKRLVRAHYVQNYGLSTEVTTPLDIVDEHNEQFIRRVALGSGRYSAPAIAIDLNAGQPPVPRYIKHDPEAATVTLIGAPEVTADRLRLWFDSMADDLYPGLTYEGDDGDIHAIVDLMVAMAREKLRETTEASYFHNQSREAVQEARRMRAKMKRRSQMGDGRFMTSGLRSVNGALSG